MFDLSFSEMAIVVMIAVVVIGPKDLPRALALAGKWIGKGRRLMGSFRTGLDAMIREAEIKEMEEKWAAENERIMREHPAAPASEAEAQMEPLPAPPPSPELPLPDDEQPDLPLAEQAGEKGGQKP